MTSQAVTAERPADGAERCRQAERAVWVHYRLQPTERSVDVAEAAARIRVVEVIPHVTPSAQIATTPNREGR